MRHFNRFGLVLLLVATFAGCASSKVTSRQSDIGEEKLARPDHIFVYDFAATPADIPADVANSTAYTAPSEAPPAKEIATGRKLGNLVANNLVAKIVAMGLPAKLGTAATSPSINDIVIRGHFESIEEGSAGKRLVLGFGSGNADLKTSVTAYQKTSQGLRKLGSGAIDSGGGKTPGVLLPLAVTVATANPIGLVVGGAVKVQGEISGRDTIEGSAERTASQIATELQAAFKRQGWI
jgi:hypothetical protein